MREQDRQQLEVRRARPDDAEALLGLVPRLVEFGPPPWREPGAMTETDMDVIAAALAVQGDDPVLFVAELAGVVVGFIHLHSRVDYYRRRPHGHVADLAVAKASQGLGVATRLLGQAEGWAADQGFDWLTISVFDANQRAAGLYEHYGFQRDTRTLLKTLEPRGSESA